MLANIIKKSKVFISYTRADMAEVEQLDERLRLGGLLTWRDLKDSKKGFPLEPQIEAALKGECSAFLMYLTPRAGSSNYINQIEVKLARELWVAKQLTIIPVFRGVTPAAATKSINDQLGFDVSSFDGMTLPDTLSRWARLAAWMSGNGHATRDQLRGSFSELARRILETHLKASVSGSELTLRLHTYEYAVGSAPGDIELDWSPAFRESPVDWTETLTPALTDIRQAAARACTARQLTVDGGGHLSAALMLGYTFSSASGFSLAIKQNGTTWDATGLASATAPLSREEEPSSPGRSDVALEVSVSNDIRGGVDRFMRTQSGRFRKRIRLSLLGGPSRQGVHDATHANAIAEQVFQEIRSIRMDPNLGTIHVFMSAPFALAVMTGRLFNACGPIQFYEFEKTKNEYVPSFTVGTGGAP